MISLDEKDIKNVYVNDGDFHRIRGFIFGNSKKCTNLMRSIII